MSEDIYQKIGEKFAAEQGCSISQMFGKPCLKSPNKKAFAAFQNDAMIFKLGKENITEFISKYEGAHLWDPSGKNRPMKDWLSIPNTYHQEWEKLSKRALAFVEG